MTKLYLLAVYAALWAVALTAPPADPSALLMPLLSFEGPDAWSIAVFNLMGVWPVLMAAVLLSDGPAQRLPAWPFVLLSFVAGAFILVPYLLVRRFGAAADTERWLARLSTHPAVAVMATAATAGLVAYAVGAQQWSVFVQRVIDNGFVRTYTADFVAFALIYPVVALDDRHRLSMPDSVLVYVPLLGGLEHLWRRSARRRSQSP